MTQQLKFETIRWDGSRVILIDQRALPTQETYLTCNEVEEVAEAIRTLAVRGAPAIGISAAMGVLLGMKKQTWSSRESRYQYFHDTCELLASTRPTAVNLFWAIKRMRDVYAKQSELGDDALIKALEAEAMAIHVEDQLMCERMADAGAELICKDATIITHCNTGALATGGIGTALGVVLRAHQKRGVKQVFVDETRPLLQGARLTAWELHKANVPATLICDNMAAHVMKTNKVDAVIVGADRIAMNGDAANKIGTYGLSILARAHGIPFYVAAPTSTVDPNCTSGEGIPIEERKHEEVNCFAGRPTAPTGVNVHNPAFDVTPAENITAIITEAGVLRPPFARHLSRILRIEQSAASSKVKDHRSSADVSAT